MCETGDSFPYDDDVPCTIADAEWEASYESAMEAEVDYEAAREDLALELAAVDSVRSGVRAYEPAHAPTSEDLESVNPSHEWRQWLNTTDLRIGERTGAPVPRWAELSDLLEVVTDATWRTDMDYMWGLDEVDADGSPMCHSEYRWSVENARRREPLANRRIALARLARQIVEGDADHNPLRRLPKHLDLGLRRTCWQAIAAIAEWVRCSPDEQGDNGTFLVAWMPPEYLADLADEAAQLLRTAAEFAQHSGDAVAARRLEDLARTAVAIAGRPANVVPPKHAEADALPPVPRTLAPPGRNITVQPVLACAPPAVRVRVAA